MKKEQGGDITLHSSTLNRLLPKQSLIESQKPYCLSFMTGSTSIDYKYELEALVNSATKYATAWACHHKEWNAAMKQAKDALTGIAIAAELEGK